MYIPVIGAPTQAPAQTNAKPRFGSVEVFDLGASNKRQGHVRVLTLNDQFQAQGPVADTTVSEKGFQNGADVITGIGNRIAEAETKYRPQLGQQDTLKEILGFVPGNPQHGYEKDLNTLLCQNGQYPKDLDFNRLPGLESQKGIPVDQRFKLHLYEDLTGGSAYAAHVLATDNAFKKIFTPGTHASYMVIGGGFGCKNIANTGDKFVLYKPYHPYMEKEARNSIDRTCVPTMIQDFAEKIGLPPEQAQALKETGNGRPVTNYQLAKTQFPWLTPANFKNAADFAVRNYVDGVSSKCCGLYLAGSNLFLLSGPSIRAVEKHLNQSLPPDLQKTVDAFNRQSPAYAKGKTNFEKIVLMQTQEKLKAASFKYPTTSRKPFEVTTALNASDNTLGWRYLLKAGEPDAKGGVSIPIESLQA